MIEFACSFSINGVLQTGLTPTITVRRAAGGIVVVAAGAVVEVGGGGYYYAWPDNDPNQVYYAVFDGGSDLLDSRYVPLWSPKESEQTAIVSDILSGISVSHGEGAYDKAPVIIPVQGRASSTYNAAGGNIVTVLGDNVTISIDLGADYTRYDLMLFVAGSNFKNSKACTWIDASVGTGSVELEGDFLPTPGEYKCQIKVIDGDDKHTVLAFNIIVSPTLE